MSDDSNTAERKPATPASGSSGGGEKYSADSQPHLLDRIAVLYRYRHVMIAVFVLTVMAIMIQGYTTIQKYQATARLLIEDERSTAIPGLVGSENTAYSEVESYYQTQYKILRGRELVRHVIGKVRLQDVPEFNGTAAPPSTPATVISHVWDSLLGLLGRRPAPEPRSQDETLDGAELVNAFISRTEVEPVRLSRLVDVSFTALDPQFAARAVNALADEYVEQNLATKQTTTKNMLEYLGKELEKQQKKVGESERNLAEYRDKQNALSLDDKQNIVITRLNTLSDAATQAKTVRMQKESLYNQVQSVPSGAVDTLAVIAQNAQVQGGRNKLVELQREKTQLSERYADKHPRIIDVNARLSDAERQLALEKERALQTVRNDYESAVIEEKATGGALEAAKADVADLSKKSINYNIMEREAKSNRQVYESLLQRENELRVTSNSQANNVRVVDHAETPKVPLAPGGRRTWLMAVALGLVLSVGVAFGLEYMNDTIKTPEDVTRRLKLPFLGLVPSVRGNRHPLLASAQVPHDFGESFRSLRTSLMSTYVDAGTKIVLVTSAQPLEGKTITATNIAMALAYGGARVLLIDADMRRPGLHVPLRLTNDRGLSQVLNGQTRVRDVIQRTVDPNLLAVTAGKAPLNPSELLSSERMKTLLTNLAHGPFDWILIDTPPVLAVTDAVILSPAVAGVVFVVGAEMTRRRLAERAVETILASGPRSVGVVLNKVDFARNKYYYSRYYGHQYKNYYAQA